MKFTWDTNKSDINRRKHGVEFNEATTIFGDPLAGTFPDTDQIKIPQQAAGYWVTKERSKLRGMVVSLNCCGESGRSRETPVRVSAVDR